MFKTNQYNHNLPIGLWEESELLLRIDILYLKDAVNIKFCGSADQQPHVPKNLLKSKYLKLR